MKTYITKADPDIYQCLVLSLNEDVFWYRRLTGFPVAQEWPTPQVDIIYQDSKGKWLQASDFPSFTVSHIPVFSAKAVEILGDVLTKNGELLPLNCIDGEYFAYNVLNLVSALDQEKSDIVRFPTGGIMTVRKYALYEVDALHLSLTAVGGDSRFSRFPIGNHPRKARPAFNCQC